MQLRRGREDRRRDARTVQGFGQVGRRVLDAVLARQRTGRLEGAAHQGDHLDVADGLDGVEVLGAEGARAGENDLHGRFSRMR